MYNSTFSSRNSFSSLTDIPLYERLRLIYNKTVFYLKYPVGHLSQLAVVGYDNNCLTECIPQFKEQFMKFILIFSVKIPRRFIGKDNRRIIDKCTGNSHTLLFSSAEFRGFMIKPVGKIKKPEKLFSPFLSILFAFTSNICRYTYILKGSEFRKKLMELKDKSYVAVAESGK